jgi:hypothetical protein
MSVEQDPAKITDEGQYWLRAQRVTVYLRIARDTYFPKHDVTRPAAVTADDLPPTTDDAVRQIDRKSLEKRYTSGKWQVTTSVEAVNDLWLGIVEEVSTGTIWDAKVMTATGREELPYDAYMVAAYTPNYFDKRDVNRVRKHLEEGYDMTEKLFYKPDIYTRNGIISETADEWGLSVPARYREQSTTGISENQTHSS